MPTQTHLTVFRKDLNRLMERRRFLITQTEEEKQRLAQEEQDVENIKIAQAHLQALAQQTQQESHKQIAKVVSKCLSAVFDEPYELRIEFVRKRGKTEADFVYLKGGRKINPRVTSGGVKDVASLALRLCSIIMTVPPVRRLLILDEPFKALSVPNLQKMGQLVKTLSDDLDMQFIIVTHSDALKIGKVISL